MTDGHGKSRNVHGKVVVKYFVKSVGTVMPPARDLPRPAVWAISSLEIKTGPLISGGMGHSPSVYLMYKHDKGKITPLIH